MNIEEFRNYCLSKPAVTEEFPFDESTLVFKVAGKMFALTNVDDFQFINLKCDPDRAITLREEYDSIRPGYHMSKKHWNSVYQEAGTKLIKELIDHSFELVVESLPKQIREDLSKY